MAVIEASGHLQGESNTEVKAGLRIAVSAQCYGRAAAGPPVTRPSQDAPQPEPRSPQGK